MKIPQEIVKDVKLDLEGPIFIEGQLHRQLNEYHQQMNDDDIATLRDILKKYVKAARKWL